MGDGVFRACQIALFRQHFHDTLCRFHGHRDHHEHHGQHHKAHEDLEAVRQDRRHLAHSHFGALAGDDDVRAEGQHEGHARIHAELHHGVVEGHDPLRPGKVPAHVLRCGGELLFLIAFPHIALDHAHGLDVLLHGVVQRVVFAEHPAEDRRGRPDDQHQARRPAGGW